MLVFASRREGFHGVVLIDLRVTAGFATRGFQNRTRRTSIEIVLLAGSLGGVCHAEATRGLCETPFKRASET